MRIILAGHPTVSRYVLRLGLALQAQGRSAEAAEAYERAAALSPRPAEIAAKVAGIYRQNGMSAEALQWAEKALAAEPDVGEALHIAGSIYLEQKRFALAAEMLDAFLQQDPRLEAGELATLCCRLSLCLFRTGREDESIAPLNRAMEIDPTLALPHLLLAQMHASAGNDGPAIEEYRQAVALNPTGPALRVELAMLLAIGRDREARNAPEALVHADEAVRLTGQADAAAWHALAVARAENGQFAAAVEAIDKAIALATEDHADQVAMWRRLRQLFSADTAVSQQLDTRSR